MRAIPSGLQARLDSGATTLCRCWRIDREDGVTLGFTDHDRALSLDGVVFEASSGLNAGAIEQSTGLSIDSHEVSGALQSAALSEADIETGAYDRARVALFLVDWSDIAERLFVSRGSIGEIRRQGAVFHAEIVGLAEALNQPVGRAYLPGCDLRLGEARCGVDTTLPAYRGAAVIVQALDRQRLVVDGLAGYQDDWFSGGHVLWTSGANAGLKGDIKDQSPSGASTALDLWLPAPLAIAVGDTLDVIAGCDKRMDTCRDKFSNLINFRGFPHMPGDDWAAGYPNTGGGHDGGSLFRS